MPKEVPAKLLPLLVLTYTIFAVLYRLIAEERLYACMGESLKFPKP